MQNAQLSVIMPVYNVKQYLERCIDSLLAQTYSAMDIVLVDDGSTDGSGAICDAYAERDGRIRVVHKANGGPVAARKVGLQHANPLAPFVTFVDGDDWIEPWAFSEMMQLAERECVDCVLAGHIEDTGTSQRKILPSFPEGRMTRAEMEQVFLPNMMGRESFFTWGIFTSLCDKMFLKKMLAPVMSMEDERIKLGDDTAVVFPTLYRTSSVFITHCCYYHYEQKKQSVVKRIEPQALERERYAALYAFVRERIPQEAQRAWEMHMLFLMVQRADALLEGWERLDVLFPFPDVPRGARIILYGAGTYGQRLWQAIQRTGIVTVVGWADRNSTALQEIGLPVQPPDAIAQMDADDIVVAISIGQARESAQRDLTARFPGKRVHVWDVSWIFSDETKKAFRLR